MLKGRPIGLSIYMSTEQMKEHLQRIKEEWEKEYDEEEVRDAIIAKCRPLVMGFYWHRYPDACERLAKVLEELGYNIATKIQKSQKKKRSSSKKIEFNGKSLLEQF